VLTVCYKHIFVIGFNTLLISLQIFDTASDAVLCTVFVYS